MKPQELFHKASVAVASSELLLKSGDFDGACNRAYYAMFDAAREVLLVTGAVADLATIKTHKVELDKAQWALKQAQEFVDAMRLMNPQAKSSSSERKI